MSSISSFSSIGSIGRESVFGGSRTLDPTRQQNQPQVVILGVALFRHLFVETLVVIQVGALRFSIFVLCSAVLMVH